MNDLETPDTLVARIVLVGRTGIDDVVRRIRGTEVIRVRNPIEAIAEVALPIDPQSPSHVVVVVGSDIAQLIQDFGNNGDGTVEFLRGLQMVHPSAALFLSVPRRNLNDPVSEGYHGTIAMDAISQECIAAFSKRDAANADEEPDAFFAGVGQIPVASNEAAVLTRTSTPNPAAPAASPKVNLPKVTAEPVHKNGFSELASYPSSLAAPGGVFVDNFTAVAVPLYAESETPSASKSPSQQNHNGAASAANMVKGVPGSAADRMLRAAMSGKDLRTEALEIIRAATGDPSVILSDGHDSLPGAPVEAEGRVIAILRGQIAAEKLMPHAAWIAQWLRLDQHLGELRQWAFTDSLTGAWNRRYFEMFLSESVAEARRLRRSLTILYFDIDDFKRWNDENGHAAGDEILTETVKLLKSVIRPTDKVCRIGGDEFAVIFHEPQGPRDLGSRHPEDLLQVAKRFQEQIRNKRFPKLAATHTPLGISGGLATYPWDARSAEELMKVADQRSMQCKRQGKNAITFGDESK